MKGLGTGVTGKEAAPGEALKRKLRSLHPHSLPCGHASASAGRACGGRRASFSWTSIPPYIFLENGFCKM